MARASNFRHFILLCVGVVLTSVTFIFGAIPMKAARSIYGRAPFWMSHGLVAGVLFGAGLYPFAAAYLALIVLVGVCTEVEEHAGSLFSAGFTAILATLGLITVSVGAWLQTTKVSWSILLRQEVSSLADQVARINPDLKISVDTLVAQMPSAVIITLIIALVIALVWERQILFWYRLQRNSFTRESLSEFRVPDGLVWLAILAVLGAFLEHGRPLLKTVSQNVLNVLLVLYFLQGLAVVTRAFRAFKVGPFWQAIWYVLLVLQLPPLVSLVGFSDFWLDYRDRLAKGKQPETKLQ